MTESIAVHTFTADDQQRFAALSGDRNPMHMDAVAARRTQAGAPVLHGMHTLLWCLDALAHQATDLPPVANMKVRFDKLVYLGESVEAVLLKRDAAGLRLEAHVLGGVALRLAATFGAPRPFAEVEPAGTILSPDQPVDLPFEAMAACSGRLGFATSPAAVAVAFPAAARHWGERRIAALTCLTRLVGMVCPGLHSIFGGLSVDVTEDPAAAEAIRFRVIATDPRFRVVRLAVSGGGLAGTVESFARMPPIAQPTVAALAGLVSPDEFAGGAALVVGGSRGLGEVTAKLLAAGGARVTLTYASGRTDAEHVRDEIAAWGGACDILQYDVRCPPEAQLQRLGIAPTQLYYFATPLISQRKSGLYSRDRFRSFCEFYVDAFYAACEYLARRNPGRLAAFYPSSVYVETHPADLTEYAMAKMAGEILCADMQEQWPRLRIIVHRIPRVLTDQTAGLVQTETAAPADVMLPIVRQVQSTG